MIRGKGIKFEYAATTADPAVNTGWTLLAFVTDAKAPEGEIDDVDTTNHDTAGNAKTFAAGLEDGGTSETTCFYDKTAYAAIATLKGVDHKFRLRFSDNSGVAWSGYVKSVTSEHPLDNSPSTMTCKTKVSGSETPVASIAALT